MWVQTGKLALFVLLLISCAINVPEDPDPGPHQTLLAIARMTRDNDYSRLDDYIYSVELGTNMTSGEFIRKGITKPEALGDFSYSPEKFIQAATEFKHLFKPALPDVLQKFFLDEGAQFARYPELVEMAKNQPQRIWEFRRDISTMIFVEDNGVYKILFTQMMTSLR